MNSLCPTLREACASRDDLSPSPDGPLPPWIRFALGWQPRGDSDSSDTTPSSPEGLFGMLLDAEGPLLGDAMPLYEQFRHELPEQALGMNKSELLRLCHYRELLANQNRTGLARRLDREIARSDHSRLFHCEILHLFWQCRCGLGPLARKAADREFMLRSELGSGWRQQRARWQSLGEPARFLAPILRGSREQGILFHPAQLEPQPGCDLARLDVLVRGLGSGALASLLDVLGRSHRLEISIDPDGWKSLRPLLVSLLAGACQPFSEVPVSCLPCSLPDQADSLPMATLVVHSPNGHVPPDHHLPAGNWRVLLLHDRVPSVPDGYTGLRLEWKTLVGDWVNARDAESCGVIPLRQYVNELEQRYILEVLRHHGGVKTRACESLGITRQTLYAKLGRRPPTAGTAR